MKTLVIDNYDSFTYNLVQIIKDASDYEVVVRRNDEITVEEAAQYGRILLSPGPGIPNEAGIMNQIIARYSKSKSILGICLGMQGIAEVFNSRLYNMDEVFHGKVSRIRITDNQERIFRQIPDEFEAGRYHSWAVQNSDFSDELSITAVDEHGIVMAIAHKEFDVKGVQFHPESVMTPYGRQILLNWFAGEESTVNLASADNESFNSSNLSSQKLFC